MTTVDLLREAMPSMSSAEFERMDKEIEKRRRRADRAAARRQAKELAIQVGPITNGFEALHDRAGIR